MGKAQAPPPGQALLFMKFSLEVRCNPPRRVCMILPVVSVTLQEFLRKIRVVMVSMLICGRW